MTRQKSKALTLDAVQFALSGVRVKDDGRFIARCPAHDDKNPSLSVSQGRDRVVWKCFAGCSQADVTSAIINMMGLAPTPPRTRRVNGGAPAGGCPFSDWPHSHEYVSTAGDTVTVYRRPDPDDPKKKQIRNWPTGVRGPWRLHYFGRDNDGPLVICEGELTAEAVAKAGYRSASWRGGIQGVRHTAWDTVDDPECILWPDHDEPGYQAMQEVARRLPPKIAVRHVVPPERAPEKWDAGDASEREITTLVEAAKKAPVALRRVQTDQEVLDDLTFPAQANVFADPPLDELELEWVIPGWIPKGMLTVVAGPSKTGKTQLVMNLLGDLTVGTSRLVVEQGTTPDQSSFFDRPLSILMETEDDWQRIVLPRLRLAGADADRSFRPLHGRRGLLFSFEWTETRYTYETKDADGRTEKVDVSGVDWLLDMVPRPDIVLVDPITTVLKKGNENSNRDVRKAIEEAVFPLLMEGITVVGILHERKDARGRHIDRILGSVAWSAVPRMVIQLLALSRALAKRKAWFSKRAISKGADLYGVAVRTGTNLLPDRTLSRGIHYEMRDEKGIPRVHYKPIAASTKNELIAQYAPPKSAPTAVEKRARIKLAERKLHTESARSVAESALQAADGCRMETDALLAHIMQEAQVGRTYARSAMRKASIPVREGNTYWRVLVPVDDKKPPLNDKEPPAGKE